MNRKFGRKKAHREHMLRNLATSLVLYETIDTTMPKAKEIKSYVERVIARSKKGDLNAIRKLHKIFFDKNAVDKIIKELVPRYTTRNSGFIKSYHLKNRLGDNSEMMRLELIDKKVFVDESKEDKSKNVKAEETTKPQKNKEENTK
ncbi:MAG: 50S ribosomal protein L17 [Patescibacteria group bacterium]